MTENIVLKLCGVQQIFTSSCLNIYIRVEEGFKITELSGHIKKLEKEQQSRRKKIIKAETNKIENKDSTELIKK